MKGKIYKIYNDVNDKLYIGKTLSTIEERFKQHCYDKTKRAYEKRPLYNAMNKYGDKYFHIELIEECDIELLAQRECYWIEYYNTYHNGYNATKGGDGRQLYDYNLIVELYQSGLLIKEITDIIGCDRFVVKNALNLVEIDSFTNMVTKSSKPIAAYTLDNILIRQFNSQSDAARWLIEEGIAQTDSIKNVGYVIGRAANGDRKTAYKMLWKNI